MPAFSHLSRIVKLFNDIKKPECSGLFYAPSGLSGHRLYSAAVFGWQRRNKAWQVWEIP
jgi:hypothetical protein